MSRSLMLLSFLAACHHDAVTAPDGSLAHDARPHDGAGSSTDAASDGSVDAAPSSCVTTGDGSLFSQCCPFASSCEAGTACYWTSTDNPMPKQATSACMASGTVPVGSACDLSNNACVPGAYCAAGTCRRLCDPAAISCDTGQTCVHMPYCTTPGNCMPATDSQIGYCQ